MLITEFLDNEHLSSLESFVLQMNDSNSENKFKVYINMPKFNQDPLLNEKVKDLMSMCQVEFFETKDTQNGAKDFEKNPEVVMNNIRSLVKKDVLFMTGESEMHLALGCLNACVNQLKLMSQGVKDFDIEIYTLSQYLRLDVAAINALNVFPQNNEVVAGSAGSLFGLLNNCKT